MLTITFVYLAADFPGPEIRERGWDSSGVVITASRQMFGGKRAVRGSLVVGTCGGSIFGRQYGVYCFYR